MIFVEFLYNANMAENLEIITQKTKKRKLIIKLT